MKLPVFIVGLLSLGLASATPLENFEKTPELRGLIDGMINKTINDLVETLPNPIELDAVQLNLTDGLIKGLANVSSFQLTGLKNLAATSINVSLITMQMNASIQIPTLLLNTKYYADITLLDLIPFYGNGRVAVTVDGCELYVSGKVSLSGGLNIANLTLSIGLDDLVFDLHGLMNNEEFSTLISTVLSDTVGDFMNTYKDLISDYISPIAGELINGILNPTKNATLAQQERQQEAMQLVQLVDAL